MASQTNFAFSEKFFEQIAGDPNLITARLGGIDARTTTSETIGRDAMGKCITLENVSPSIITFDSADLFDHFMCFVQNRGTGAAEITTTTGDIDDGFGAESSKILNGGESCAIFFDGLDYRMLKGSGGGGGGGGSTTFGLDLFEVDATHQKVVGFNGNPLDTAAALADACFWQWNAAVSKYQPVVDRPAWPVAAIPGIAAPGQEVLIFVLPAAMIFPANFATPNSRGRVKVNPATAQVYTVFKNGITVGSVSISTSGVFTFATTGGASWSGNAGDVVTIEAPGTVDPSMAGLAITLVGQRSQTLAAGEPVPILNNRGAYNPVAVYQPFDFVYYTSGGTTSTYLCKLAGTSGVLPTNTTNWQTLAQGAIGATGSTTYNGTTPPSSGLGNDNDYYIETTGGANSGLIAAGDLAGPNTLPKVVGWQAVPLDATMSAPTNGQVPVFDSALAKWKAGTGGSTVRDVAGSVTVASPTQIRFPNRSVSNPSAGIAQVAGGWVLLATQSASSSAQIDFVSLIDSTFDIYIFVMLSVVPSTNATSFHLRLSQNNGSTFDSSAIYNCSRFYHYQSTVAADNQTGNTSLQFNENMSSSATQGGLSGTFFLYDPLSVNYTLGEAKLIVGNHTGINTVLERQIIMQYQSAAAVNAVRFFPGAGVITSGIFRVYGLSK